MTTPLPVVQPRQCGGCVACCFAVGVAEINKPRHTMCPHVGAVQYGTGVGTGCKIHEQAPGSCKRFKCEWLLGNVPEEQRPDKCGIVFTRMEQPIANAVVLTAFEYIPGGITSPVNQDLVGSFASKEVVLTLTNSAMGFLGPTREVVEKFRYRVNKRARQLGLTRLMQMTKP